MPDEPNKNIEPLLTAYAKKRREDAGAPLELHPATRKLLQDEVARTHRETEEAPRPESPFAFWRRLAFGVGAVTALIAVVVITLTPANKAKKRGTYSAAEADAPRLELAQESLADREAPVKLQVESRDARADAGAPAASTSPSPPPAVSLSRRGGLANADKDADQLNRLAEDKSKTAFGIQPEGAASSRTNLTATVTRAGGLAGTPSVQSTAESLAAGRAVPALSTASSAPTRSEGTVLAGTNAAFFTNSYVMTEHGTVTNGVVVVTRLGGSTGPVSVEYAPGGAGGFGGGKAVPAAGPANEQSVAQAAASSMERQRQLAVNQPSMNKSLDDVQSLSNREKENLALSLANARGAPAQSSLAPTDPAKAAAVDSFALAKQKADTQLAAKPTAPAAPAPAEVAALYFKTNPANQNGYALSSSGANQSQRFSQVDNRAQYRRNFNSPPTPNVLTTFQVDRSDNQVRITDADGSVYDGQVLAEGDALGDLTVKGGEEARRKLTLGEAEKLERAQVKNINGNFADQANPQNWSFQATGMNRTLNQSVVLRGSVVFEAAPDQPEADEKKPAGNRALSENAARAKTPALRQAITTPSATAGQDAALKKSATPQPTWQFRGRATVGGKNQFEIQAVPSQQ